MNVADLLQSSPSDEHARRRAAAAAQHKAPPQQPLQSQPQQPSSRPPHSSSQQLPGPPQQSRAYYPGPPPPPAPNRPPPQGPSTFDLRDAQRAPPRERERDRDRDRDSILYAPVNEPSPMYTGPAPADSGPVPARGRPSQHHQHPPPLPPPHQQHPHPHQHQHHHAPVVPMSVTVERRHHRPSHSHSHTPQPHVVPPVRERVDAAVGMDVEHGIGHHHHHPVSLSPHRITHLTHGHGHTHTAHVHHPRAGTLVDPPPPPTHVHHSHPHSHAHVLPQHHQQHPHPPPQPPTAPKPIKYLGSYTLPQTPFPYTFSARDANHSVRLTLIIPRRALPDEAYAPRIWGGCAADLERVREGGVRSNAGGGAAVYTDDSDPVGAAVHAGFVKWSTLALARERGADLRMEVELRGDVVRYVGGVGRAYGGGLEGEEELVGKEGNGKRNGYRYEEEEEEDDGRGVVSAGWGNGHDGAGFEIVRAGLVQTGMAHGTRRARTHRLKEYASRRAEMMLTPRTMKRGYPFGEDEEEDAYGPEARARKAAVVQPRAMEPEARPTILLGAGSGWDANVYRYDPTHLRHALFPPPPPKRTRKRPRRDSSPFPSSSSPSTTTPRTVILETACERFAVRPVSSEGQGKWEIVLLGRFGKAAMSLSRTNSDYGGASPMPRSPLNNDAPTPPQPFLTPYTNTSLAPSSTSNGENGSGLPPEYPAHDLTRASFAFAGDELRILGPAEPRSGARAGWALDVRRWWVEPVPQPSPPAPAPSAASGSASVLVPVEEAEKEAEQDVQMEQPTAEVIGAGVGGVEMPEPVVQQTASVERVPMRGAEGAVVPSAAAAADPVDVPAPVGEVVKEMQGDEGGQRDVAPPGMLPPPNTDADSAVEVQSSAQLAEEPAGSGGATTEPTVAPAVPDIQPVLPLPLIDPAPSADVVTSDHSGAATASAAKDTGAAEQQAIRPASPADAARAMGFEPAPASTAPVPATVGEDRPATVLASVSAPAPVAVIDQPTSAPLSIANVTAAGGQTTQEDVEDGEIASSSGGDAPPPIGETVSAAAPALAGAMGGDGMDVDV
ncbi:hypothetical protein PENSPDRAFT_734454 [Peniophora sp. CONT]|nr:hypothetical protein PENSPDRAFT_734454 [Peniophora sp. CONT]